MKYYDRKWKWSGAIGSKTNLNKMICNEIKTNQMETMLDEMI